MLPRRRISTYLHTIWKLEEATVDDTPDLDGGIWHPERVPRGWVEAGRSVDARRALMGLSVKELARKTGVDPRTVADLIHARRESFTDLTLANLERALAWRQGAILSMATEGREPEDEEGLAEVIAAWPDLSPELRAVLVRIVQTEG